MKDAHIAAVHNFTVNASECDVVPVDEAKQTE